MKGLMLLACVCVSVSLQSGCGPASQEMGEQNQPTVGLPVIRGSKLNDYVRASQSPVLVEFGVDFNCPRCAQTKSDIVRLRENLEGDIDVVRVDFNANAQMVAQFGGTICPTYVLFENAEPVMSRSFPVSIDLLEGEILRQSENRTK